MTPPALTAYLSGAEDATTDHPFPLATFGLSKRSAAPSYYRVSTPASTATLAAFADRPNGKVHILANGAPWESFNVTAFTWALGPVSAMAQVIGTRQETNAVPASHALTPGHGLEQSADRQGRLVLQTTPDLAIRAGDTVTWAGTAYTVDLVTLAASADRLDQTLTLTEQTP